MNEGRGSGSATRTQTLDYPLYQGLKPVGPFTSQDTNPLHPDGCQSAPQSTRIETALQDTSGIIRSAGPVL